MKTSANNFTQGEHGMHSKRFIRRPELCSKIGLGVTSIYKLECAGKFPGHFMLTPRCAVWELDAVEKWMDARIAAPAIGTTVPDVSTRRAGGRMSAKCSHDHEKLKKGATHHEKP